MLFVVDDGITFVALHLCIEDYKGFLTLRHVRCSDECIHTKFLFLFTKFLFK